MKLTIIILLVVLVLFCCVTWLLSYFPFSPSPEIKTVTSLSQSQIDDIQSEFGFELPDGANIDQCKLANSKDRLFTVIICGVLDEAEFINNNLRFKVEESYEIEHYAYDTSKMANPIMVDYYFGIYNGSKRGVYVYSIDSELIIELEKSGIVSKNLLEMFREL